MANVGDQALEIDAAFDVATAVSDLNAQRFTGSSTLPGSDTTAPCAASLALAANGGRCGLAITLLPEPTVLAGALQTASLVIRSNGGSRASALILNGRRVAPAAAILTLGPPATSYVFGSTAAGSSSAPTTISLRNTGAAALTVSALAIGARERVRLYAHGNCANLVAAGSSCTISIQFRPRSIGSKSETLTIKHSGGSISVALPGIGQSANIADGKGGGCVLPLVAPLLLGLFVAGRVRRSG